jgi:D-glycero-alpha-D-manno-heptose-7-phosphate kinase
MPKNDPCDKTAGMTEVVKIVNASAPTRICDNGGWTDTWFAGHGRIFNIAIAPRVEVQIRCLAPAKNQPRVLINAANFGDRYAWAGWATGRYERHPLLEATIDQIGLPAELALEIDIHSEAPHGASMGTSAAVCVALAAALDALTPGRRTPHDLAYAAHAVETEKLGQQSGIQDQLAAAYGGINYIEMDDYPAATVTQLALPPAALLELERRLILVYLGWPHQSSAVHEMVIRGLEAAGPAGAQLEPLRQAAAASRAALLAGDFAAFGAAMQRNTEAQRALHPALVGDAAQAVIGMARQHGALGWKVNGAGGDGGSVAILTGPDRMAARALRAVLLAADPAWRLLPLALSPAGVQVW